METTTASQETIELLNDLLAINNDRVAGYDRAINEISAEEIDLKALFASMRDESRSIRIDIAAEVKKLGGEFEAGTTLEGKLYRAWLDVKEVFSGRDRYEILAGCERGEDAAQNAYRHALEDYDISSPIRNLLESQKQILKASHNKIKLLRDAAY